MSRERWYEVAVCAMVAELAHVPEGAARWRFAAGCLRAALFPARGAGVPALVTGVAAALPVAGAGFGVGAAVPALRAFAVTFVALAGAMVTLAVARSGGVRRVVPDQGSPSPGSPAWPRAWRRSRTPWSSTRRRLRYWRPAGRSCLRSRWRRRCGSCSRRRADWPATASPAGPAPAGVQAAIWTALLGAPLIFAIGVPEAMYQYGLHAELLLDGEGGEPIGTNLNDFIWVLIGVPLLGLPFGVIGAAAAARLRRRGGKAPEMEAPAGGSAAGA